MLAKRCIKTAFIGDVVFAKNNSAFVDMVVFVDALEQLLKYDCRVRGPLHKFLQGGQWGRAAAPHRLVRRGAAGQAGRAPGGADEVGLQYGNAQREENKRKKAYVPRSEKAWGFWKEVVIVNNTERERERSHR